MNPIWKIEQLRDIELKIAKVMVGKTSAEICALAGCEKKVWDKFLQYHRQGRIRGVSTGKTNTQRYYFVRDTSSFIDYIEDLRGTEKKCKECGLVKPLKEMSFIQGRKLSEVCKVCAKKIAESNGITCKDCGRVLPARCFHKAQNGTGGRAATCTECKKSRSHESSGKVAGIGFRSWAIIDTSVHLAAFDRLGYELWGEAIPEDKVFERRRR